VLLLLDRADAVRVGLVPKSNASVISMSKFVLLDNEGHIQESSKI
jgi:hypothetical protein